MKGTKPTIQQSGAHVAGNRSAPSWLSVAAKREWKRVMPILAERRILTTADLGNLENYCIAIGRVREFEGEIQGASNAELKLKLFRAQDKAMASARQLAAELGLTPVSRSRPAMRHEPDEGDDPLNLS